MSPFLASPSATHSGTGTNVTTRTLGLEDELCMIGIEDLKNGDVNRLAQNTRVRNLLCPEFVFYLLDHFVDQIGYF